METISNNVPLNSAISPKDPATAVVPAVAVDPEAAVDPEVDLMMTFLAVTTRTTSMAAATTISLLKIVMP